MKKINLEKILFDIGKYNDNDISFLTIESILAAMKEAVKQALELAAENATAKIQQEWSGNTGSEYCDEYAVVNKKSILNIINQIE